MPTAHAFYHYYRPDDVISAMHFAELCEELVRRGWQVTARPSNRSCRNESERYPLRDRLNGVLVRRIWRPALPQSSAAGRLANAGWMIARWSLSALRNSPDVVIIGTDPILSVMAARIWKLLRPRTRIAHWCFDLYPEAAIADGMLDANGRFAKALRASLRGAYRSCDVLADIGECMRERLAAYGSKAVRTTLTPWALEEPDSALQIDETERAKIFGTARLALLYSGNFGRAHSSELLLKLMRRLETENAHLAFSIRGNRAEALRAEARDNPNIGFVGFAPPSNLAARLSAPDIHVVSLQETWTGAVVPSKFFGALAAGRPVLFAGSPDSSIARWIRQYQAGWVLTEATFESVARELAELSRDPVRIAPLFTHCHAIYQNHFSKRQIADRWNLELRAACEIG